MNKLQKEQLQQMRIRFYLTSILILTSATFCFTGVGLMWSGTISQDAAIQGMKLVSNVAIAGTKVLDRVSSQPIETLPDDEDYNQ